MTIFEAILLSAFIVSMISFLVTAIAATFCIDPKKRADAGSLLNLSSLFVPENVLTPMGLRIAKIRNYSLLIFGLLGVCLGIYINLIKM